MKIPRNLQRKLDQDDWTQVVSKPIKSGCVQLILQSNRLISAFKFDLDGNITDSATFNADNEEIELLQKTMTCDYEGNLFQLSLVSDQNKLRKKLVANPAIEKCDIGHLLVEAHYNQTQSFFD